MRRARRYEALEDALRGDVHEVCPKFLAFKGPLRPGHPARQEGEVAFPAEHYARLFRNMGVRAVVPRRPSPLHHIQRLWPAAKAPSSGPHLLLGTRPGDRGVHRLVTAGGGSRTRDLAILSEGAMRFGHFP